MREKLIIKDYEVNEMGPLEFIQAGPNPNSFSLKLKKNDEKQLLKAISIE